MKLRKATTFAVSEVCPLARTIAIWRSQSIRSDADHLEFAFANDTSGVLAAVGLNTFFNGTELPESATFDLGVSSAILQDATKFAASRGGIGEDAENAELLANLLDQPVDSASGNSLAQLYDQMVGETTQAAAVTRSVAEGFRAFQITLEGQQMAVSGVNIDEEAVSLIAYQRSYQASARFVATVSELMEVLINL